MTGWELYESRRAIDGNLRRQAVERRTVKRINRRLPDNLSYTMVDVYPPENGYNIVSDDFQMESYIQDVAIINDRDKFNIKTIISMPGDDITLGSLIFWMDSFWLVTERDSNTTLYTKATLTQCNHLLKWVDKASGKIIEQWSVISDSSDSGVSHDSDRAMRFGDTQIHMVICKNEFTQAFGREDRFLIDDIDAPHKLSFNISRPMKMWANGMDNRLYDFVLEESSATEDDNHELGVADYYKYFSRNGEEPVFPTTDPQDNNTTEEDKPQSGKKVWL